VFGLRRQPKVARQATGQTFAAVIDLSQSLLALVAASDAVVVRHWTHLAAAASAAAPFFYRAI
jgi:hypothetical protein